MTRLLALIVAAAAGSAIWIASGQAQSAAPPATTPSVGSWQVIALAAGTNDAGGTAILLNSTTGETWLYLRTNETWQKLEH